MHGATICFTQLHFVILNRFDFEEEWILHYPTLKLMTISSCKDLIFFILQETGTKLKKIALLEPSKSKSQKGKNRK